MFLKSVSPNVILASISVSMRAVLQRVFVAKSNTSVDVLLPVQILTLRARRASLKSN